MGGFLDGTYPEPAEFVLKSTVEAEASTTKQEYVMNYDYIMWRRSDRLLHGWIVGTLSDEVLGLAVGLETSAAVWKALSEYFARNTKDREFFLMQKMHLHNKQNYKTINDYIRGFKDICDELDAIGKSMEDQQKVFGLLKGLGTFTTARIGNNYNQPSPRTNMTVPITKNSHRVADINQNENTNLDISTTNNEGSGGQEHSNINMLQTPHELDPTSKDFEATNISAPQHDSDQDTMAHEQETKVSHEFDLTSIQPKKDSGVVNILAFQNQTDQDTRQKPTLDSTNAL
ncbi:hypothetical protein WN943_015489 [Citrus x changshan-huyou]